MRRGDWFLASNYTVIILYDIESPPYKLPMILTPRIFVLEYVRQMLEVDNLHFIKLKKKGRTEFLKPWVDMQ